MHSEVCFHVTFYNYLRKICGKGLYIGRNGAFKGQNREEWPHFDLQASCLGSRRPSTSFKCRHVQENKNEGKLLPWRPSAASS